MKSWPEWLELWKAEVIQFGKVVPPLLSSSRLRVEWEASFDRLEMDTRNEVDAGCLYWSEHHEWPLMSETGRWFILMRLLAAAEISLAVMPSSNGIPPIVWAPHMDERTARLWFLTDAWTTGRQRYKEKVCEIAEESSPVRQQGKN